VIRRLALLPLALVATLSLALAACSSPPAAPALTNPTEIVTKGVTSLQGVTSFEVTGAFTGSLTASQFGSFDLSTIKLAAAADIANKAFKLSFDAPSLLGSKLDAIVVGDTAYYKVAGALAAALHGSADKYTKAALPSQPGNPIGALTDMTRLVTELQASLDKLPSPLTKAADEKCGDLDCYHVSTVLTSDQLKTLSSSSTLDGDVTVDLWTRKSDYRPARIGLSIVSPSLGTIGMTFDIKYDVSVGITAPSADQIAP
jgi:hypothetical protein